MINASKIIYSFSASLNQLQTRRELEGIKGKTMPLNVSDFCWQPGIRMITIIIELAPYLFLFYFQKVNYVDSLKFGDQLSETYSVDSGPSGYITFFSCWTHLSMKHILLVNVKIVRILIFISRLNFMLGWPEHGNV